MKGTWRSYATPIIRDVIKTVGTEDEKVLRAALREAYPFGQRAMHPYKIWCDEIKVQLGKRRFGHIEKPTDPNQEKLF